MYKKSKKFEIPN